MCELGYFKHGFWEEDVNNHILLHGGFLTSTLCALASVQNVQPNIGSILNFVSGQAGDPFGPTKNVVLQQPYCRKS